MRQLGGCSEIGGGFFITAGEVKDPLSVRLNRLGPPYSPYRRYGHYHLKFFIFCCLTQLSEFLNVTFKFVFKWQFLLVITCFRDFWFCLIGLLFFLAVFSN